MDIYLIRHTKVAVSQRICYGASDVELDELAYDAQSEKIKTCIGNTGNTLFFSSPLSRCRRLAVDLASYPGAGEQSANSGSVIYDDSLKEFNFGDWELKAWNDIAVEELNPWMADFVNQKPPGGENFLELSNRVTQFWNQQIITLSHESENIAIVSHGGCIRAFLSHILGLPLRNAYRIHLDYGSVSKVSVQNNNLTVSYINR